MDKIDAGGVIVRSSTQQIITDGVVHKLWALTIIIQ